jgi:hypothetical protein
MEWFFSKKSTTLKEMLMQPLGEPRKKIKSYDKKGIAATESFLGSEF